MSYEVLKNRIKTNNLPHFMHFYGEETYLLSHSLNAVKKMIAEGFEDFNLVLLEGDVTVDDIDVSVNTPPMMGDKKLLILKETGLFTAKAANKDVWRAAFSEPADFLYVVACENNFDKRSAVYKAFSETALSVNFEKRTKAEIKSWIAKFAAKKGKIMKNDAAEYFVDSVGVDMNTASLQLEKLVNYIGERQEISKEDIDASVTREYFTKEYMLTDALLNHKKSEAVRALSELLIMRYEPIALLFAIASSYMSVFKAKLVLLGDGSEADAVKYLKIPNAFVAKKCVSFAKKNDENYLRRAIELIKDADFRMKSGLSDPKVCIETLVFML
ncbi:MAG: DNA polymerase III subunit delta [Clostridia bacterium]|nr:DNA polymerase III subunit delta [Clostridia bacterium]